MSDRYMLIEAIGVLLMLFVQLMMRREIRALRGHAESMARDLESGGQGDKLSVRCWRVLHPRKGESVK